MMYSKIVLFKNLLEKTYEDINFGILLDNDNIVCLECGSEFEPDTYEILLKVQDKALIDYNYILALVHYNNSDDIETKVKKLKIMHSLMCKVDDGELYTEWITYGMPYYCPSNSDFESISNDNQAYKKCYDLFCKILKKDKYPE